MQTLTQISTDWISVSDNSGSANTTISLPSLIGYSDILVYCIYKDASGYRFGFTNVVRGNGGDAGIMALNPGNLYLSFRNVRWIPSVGHLDLMTTGKSLSPTGTTSSDDLLCFVTAVKGINNN